MALFDKVKEQASQVAKKAQEAGKAGQAKIEDAQAKRKFDGMLRDLGAAVYAEKTGEVSDNSAEIDRIVGELKAADAEREADAASAGGTDTTTAKDDPTDTPEGGFTL
ncbi:MAG: hypothetical protein WA359_06400 [Acidimicrobiales bacterium]